MKTLLVLMVGVAIGLAGGYLWLVWYLTRNLHK